MLWWMFEFSTLGASGKVLATLAVKRGLVNQIKVHLEAELAALVKSAKTAADAATDEESRPENKYDTRGLEASYLAGAQAERAAIVRTQLLQLEAMELRVFSEDDPVQLSALVELEHDAKLLIYFVMTVGAGYALDMGGRVVTSITPSSPLGSALIGKHVGDVVELRAAQNVKTYEIISIH